MSRTFIVITVVSALVGSTARAQQVVAPLGCQPECPAPPSPVPNPNGSGFGVNYADEPTELLVSQVANSIDVAYVTDVEVVDWNLDGRLDIAAAWFKTNLENRNDNVRMVTIFYNQGANEYTRGPDISVYVPDPIIPTRSIFYNGTSELTVGDFDGDQDKDLAVLPYFGDELWFIENLGGGAYAKMWKPIFGINTTGQFQTPPDSGAADFDGDGRDELVYIGDGIVRNDPYFIHFWRTSSTISAMQRVNWEHIPTAPNNGITGTYGLAIGDWDRDGYPDLAFTGWDALNLTPFLMLWYKLNPQTLRFAGHFEYPAFQCSDVEAVMIVPNCRPGLAISNMMGNRVQYWVATSCSATVDFQFSAETLDFAGNSPGRGMTLRATELTGDYLTDLVAKQMSGSEFDDNQIEISVTTSTQSGYQFNVLQPSPLSSLGYEMDETNNLLRPRALAVADLCGNTLPEIIAGFGESPPRSGAGQKELRVGIWTGCVGDVSRDGQTNLEDLAAVLAAFDCADGPAFDPDADLNKDGCVDVADLSIAIADLGHRVAR